ncbi:hypothetical protein WMW72_28015 [Paenibacillus filicis]|uniref:Uncharacterized protein n=1 Tax=Paenibacillus filicis TaxID=669464 RepID=A0ABU9DUK2_9BACL
MKLFFEQSGTPLRAGQADGYLSGSQAMWGLSWGSYVARDKLSLVCYRAAMPAKGFSLSLTSCRWGLSLGSCVARDKLGEGSTKPLHYVR